MQKRLAAPGGSPSVSGVMCKCRAGAGAQVSLQPHWSAKMTELSPARHGLEDFNSAVSEGG